MKNCFHVIVLDSFSIGITLKQNNEHESSLINYKFFGFFFFGRQIQKIGTDPSSKRNTIVSVSTMKMTSKGLT